MIELFYHLFIVSCLFIISLSGLLFAVSMWRKSANECKRECCQDD